MSEGPDIEDTPEGEAGEGGARRGSRVSRVARRTTLQLGVVLLILLGGTQTSFFRDAVREQLVPTINESLDGRLKVGGLEGSLLGGLELTDVEVYDARDNLVARVDRAKASYSLFELTSRRLALEEIEVTGGLVVVRAYPDGELNVGLIAKPSDEPPAEGPGAVSVHIGALTLSDAHVLYVDERPPAEDAPELPEGLAPLAARLDGAVDGGAAEVAKAWAADASALTERAQVGVPRAAALLGVSGEVALDIARSGDIEVRLSELAATTRADTMVGAVGLKIEGVEVGLYSDAVTASSVRGELAGATLWEGLSAGVGYGPATGEVRPLESLYVSADTLGVTRAQLDAAAPEAGVLAGFTGRLRVGGGVEDVRVHLDGAFEGGVGEVALGGRLQGVVDALLAGGKEATTGASSFEAYVVARGLDVSSVYDVGPKVKLSARAGVKGSGLDLDALAMKCDIRVHDASVDRVELESFEAELVYAEGKASIDRAVLRTPYVDAEASGWATRGGEFDVALDARTEARHVGEVRVGGEGEEPITVPRDATLGVKAKGSLDLEHTEDPVVMTRDLDMKGSWSIAGFEGGGVEIADSTGKVDVEVRTPEKGARTWRYDIDARVKRLRAPDVVGDGVKLDIGGDTRVTAPLSNPLKLFRKLRSDTRLDADRFDGFGVSLNGATMRAVTRPDGLGLGYEIDAKVGPTSVRTGGVKAILRGAEVDLDGAVSLNMGATSAARALRALGVAGTASVQGLSAPGLASARSVAVELDVKGQVAAMHGKASVDVKSGEASGVPFDRVEASVALTPERAFAWGLAVSRPNDELPARVELDGKGKLPESLDRLAIEEMRLKINDGNVWRVADAAIDVRSPGAVRFEEVELRNSRQKIRLDGVYRSRGVQDLTASLKSVDLARVRRDFGLDGLIAPVVGKVPELTMTLQGTARDPRIDVKGGVDGVSYDGVGPVTLDTWAKYRMGRLTLTTFDLDGLGHEDLVDAQAMIPVRFDLLGNAEVFWTKSLVATATVHPIDLSDVARAVPALGVEGLDGTISGTLVASGTLEEPTVDSTFHGYDVEVKREFGDQSVNVSDVDVDVKFDYAPPRGKEGGLDTDVKVRWEGNEQVRFDLATPLPFAKWIYDVVERGEEIDFAAQTLAQPYDLDVQIKGLDLRKVDVRPLLSGPDAAGVLFAEITGKGHFDDPVLDFGVRMGEMKGGSPFECGEMKGEAWKAPRRRKGESVDGFGWGRFRDILMRLNGSVRDGKLTLDCLKVNWDRDDVMTATGEVPLPMNVLYEGAELEDVPIDFDIVLHDNELRKLSAVDYDTFAALVGTIRGEIEATGSLRKPEIDGVLEVVNTGLGMGQVGTIHLEVGAIDEVARTRAWLKIGDPDEAVEVIGFGALARMNLDLLGLADGASLLDVSARPARVVEGGGKRGELTEGDDLRFVAGTAGGEVVRLQEVFPVAYFASSLKGLKGDMQVDMDLSGTYAAPKLRGEIVLSGAEATVLSLGRKFEDVAARLKLDDEVLELEGFEVREGQSTLEMEARLTHQPQGAGEFDATMRSDRFDLGSFADFPAFVTSVVTVEGNLWELPLKMDVEVSELDVRLPDDLGGDLHPTELEEDIVIVRRSEDEDALKTIPGVDVDLFAVGVGGQRGFEMDIGVTFADGSMIYHPYGVMAFNGKMNMGVENGETSVVGEIVGERGHVEFLDKRFTLQNASVEFTGQMSTPQLRIDAVYFIDRSVAEQLDAPRDGKARVVIRIDGTPSDPKLKLISDPALTDTEILYILATGRPPSTAEVGQDQGVVSAALGAASGLALAMLQDSLSIKIPLDVIRLEGGTGGQAIGGFEVGKYLTPELFVSYRQRFSSSEQASESILGIEYQFASKWKFETTLSTNSAASFNIFRDLL